jgi:hypothetical protein
MGLGQTGTTDIQERCRSKCVRSQSCPVRAAHGKLVDESFDRSRAQCDAGQAGCGDRAPMVVPCNPNSVSNKAKDGTL